jgi:ribosomal protein S4
MRLRQKFKIFKQLKHWQNADYFPSKLFKTNKKSWKQLLSTYNIQKNKKLIGQSDIKLNSIVKTRRWSFNRKLYKSGLEIKRYYYHIFDYIIRNKILKRIYLKQAPKYKENNFINAVLYLLKPNFRLDILLWSLGFFNSVYESRCNIFKRNILLNQNRNAQPNNILNTGDIISLIPFKKDLIFKKIISKKIYFKKQFYVFCEIDYYSKTVIIVNDISNILQSYENPQVFFKKLDIRKFVTYLKREY